MKIIDTHTHLYLEEFDIDLDEVFSKAIESGIDTFLLPNVDITTIDRLHSVCDKYPDYAFPMMGLHPTSVQSDYAKQLGIIERQTSKREYCAIGEIGIDLYWDKTYLKEQKIVFEEQLRWSIEMNLPVAIHTRDAWPEVFDSIYKVDYSKLYGVFHSFSGGLDVLSEVIKLAQFKLGINGVITFKNTKLTEVVEQTDIKHIVLETDAPYLAPVPYRGKRNEPLYIWKIAEKIAELYGLSIEEIIQTTRENSLKVFRNINKFI